MASALDRLKALQKEVVGNYELPGHNPDLTDLGNEIAQQEAFEVLVNNLMHRTVVILEESASWILDEAKMITEPRTEPRQLNQYLSAQFFDSVNS